MCDLGETPSLGLDMQDGWDSSIQMLWQLEQQEPLHPHLLPNDASATLENRQAEFLPTASEVENIGTQRRLHNRKVAQKRFRQREKVCILQVRSASLFIQAATIGQSTSNSLRHYCRSASLL